MCGPGRAGPRGLVLWLRSSLQIITDKTAPANISEDAFPYDSRLINRESYITLSHMLGREPSGRCTPLLAPHSAAARGRGGRSLLSPGSARRARSAIAGHMAVLFGAGLSYDDSREGQLGDVLFFPDSSQTGSTCPSSARKRISCCSTRRPRRPPQGMARRAAYRAHSRRSPRAPRGA